MSFNSKLIAGAAALTMVGGLGIAATAGTAIAGTPSCGPTCVNLFQAKYGGFITGSGATAQFNPAFVTDVYKRRQIIGTPIIQFRASNTDPAEDWTVSNQGNVSAFFAAGLVSAALAVHYGCEVSQLVTCPNSVTVPAPTTANPNATAVVTPDLFAFEWEYAPYGADSGLCMGVAATAVQNETVTLQPCGVSAKTIWILDFLAVKNVNGKIQQVSPDPVGAFGIPVINGSDTNFSHPFVLTYNGDPTAFPRASVYVSNLTGFAQQASGIFLSDASLETIADTQQWQLNSSILP